jgi:hypothetical protein
VGGHKFQQLATVALDGKTDHQVVIDLKLAHRRLEEDGNRYVVPFRLSGKPRVSGVGFETGRSRLTAPSPPRFGIILGDCVHNLRSSLDVLMWQLVLLRGGPLHAVGSFRSLFVARHIVHVHQP